MKWKKKCNEKHCTSERYEQLLSLWPSLPDDQAEILWCEFFERDECVVDEWDGQSVDFQKT